MAKRPKIPRRAEQAVLVKSRRHCCLCFWLSAVDEVQVGQIAHLDQDKSNNKEDNLCFLCLNHHDEYDSTRSQSKGLKKGETKFYRDELYKEMEFRFHALEVDRKLRLAKRAIRECAHDGLVLRARKSPSRQKAEAWRNNAARIVKRFAGIPAEFDFSHCHEGAGRFNLTDTDGIRAYLWRNAYFLKELAAEMDATDLAETGVK